MRIATTTEDFIPYCKTYEEIIDELYRAGFRYIDLSMYKFTPDDPLMQDGFRERAKRIREYAERLGMKFVQAHSKGGNPLSKNVEHVDFLTKATIRSIEVCEILGIENTVVHPGLLPDVTKEEWFVKNKEFYLKLLEVAEKCGVNVLCENSYTSGLDGKYFITTGADMREFIEFVDHPRFHGCWDTGHANCEGNQYDEIMALGEHLKAIHYNDNHGGEDEHIAPFMGTLNHDEVISALIDVGFSGYFTLEATSSLRPYNVWTGDRRRPCGVSGELRLSEPQLFMQRHIEAMMYDTARWMLESYGIWEA